MALSAVAASAHADCWHEAGVEFGIQPALLYAIAQQESNLNPRAIGYNRNGSRDIGIMQVNSMHLPRLARQRITENSMLVDSCQSVKVGAGILAGFMRRYGYSWEAVGAYNAGTATDAGAQERRRRYAASIAVRYRLLLKADGAANGMPQPPAPHGTPTAAVPGLLKARLF